MMEVERAFDKGVAPLEELKQRIHGDVTREEFNQLIGVVEALIAYKRDWGLAQAKLSRRSERMG